MPESPNNAKVISITRGFGKAKKAASSPAPVAGVPAAIPAETPREAALRQLLDGLHSRVRAVLVAREGKWQFLERIREDPASRSVLSEIALPDLLAILDRSGVRGEEGERITISPWTGFDLAILLRDGRPHCAACFDEGTSIYVAEAALPEIARFFDEY